jgi:excisionase family DNA binding protein
MGDRQTSLVRPMIDSGVDCMRYRVTVSRVQVAERYVRAVDEEEAAKRIQDELDRPYGFFAAWRTTGTDIDIQEVESALQMAPPPLGEGGAMLLSVKEAAQHLGISRSMLYQLLMAAEIRHVSVGSRKYISRDALKEFIETNSHAGVAYRYA